ncbi:MAG: hypothetical protein AB7P76_11100 [Candidatus Melainabacteria bacterium]
MLKALQRKCRGQGVVEYAGALVIACVLVGAVIASTPSTLYEFLTTLQEGIFQYLADQVATL